MENTSTFIGQIPNYWDVYQLKDVLQVLKNGLTIKQNKDMKGYPITRIETISDGRINSNKIGYVEKVSKKEFNQNKLIDGDILFSHINSTAHIGKTAIYKDEPGVLLHGMNLLLMRPNKEKVKPDFLFYLLNLLKNRRLFEAICKKAVNQASINQSEIGMIHLPLPPLPEQEKIAEVLSTTDQAIQKSDDIIAQTERLKKGTMQKLLTEGIGHEEFKDTSIGKIPVEWNLGKLGDTSIVKLVMGQSPPSITYNKEGEGLPFLQGKAEFGEIYPKPKLYCSEPMKIAEKNDLLLSIRAPVGDVNLATNKYCIGRGLAAIRAKNEKLDHIFLFNYIRMSSARFEMLSTGSTFKAIRKGEIEKFSIPLPGFNEQKKIAQILTSIDDKYRLETKRREKLQNIKKGLMNDLLTGHKRVQVK